jgi:1-aminocyclopropane-1-carboxylate deaminase/D-cysteine desulfhydrase-like pyridoxal-dependent ACC family enzyme
MNPDATLPGMNRVVTPQKTPVERLAALSQPNVNLWVKRDDLTHPTYGGNKVRKLTHILREAKERGFTKIITIGAAGSHHVLATTIFGAQAGFAVEAALVPQPSHPHVEENLRAGLGFGLRPFVARTYASVPFTVLRRLSEQTMYVPVGGSSVLGAMGYVDATRELAEQIRNGEMPKPDIVIVTLGSGGTVAGIAAGLVAEGIDAKVIGVLVAEPPWAIELTARRLTRKVARKIGIPSEKRPDRDLVTDTRYLGRGYGFTTPEGELAMKRAAEVGLKLDPTYTSKTFAAALDLVEAAAAKNILYWHTLSSAPMGPLLKDAPSSVPENLLKLLL